MKRWLVAAFVYLFSRTRRRPPIVEEEHERLVAPQRGSPGAELVVLALLGAASILAIVFIVVYAVNANTQLLGLSLGGAFLALSAALVLTAKRVIPDEEEEEEYSPPRHPYAEEEIEQILDESGEPVTRRTLLKLAAGSAGAAVGAALVVPLLSLGPALDTDRLLRTPWRAGRRLVDREGRPIRVDELDDDSFLTAFPSGADPEELGSPLVVVRLPENTLDLPSDRAGWAPEGVVAYSKICTHAGCAISIYRSPLYDPTSPNRALVCPCHYSTFDPTRAAAVTFGPAGRPLPQLPLAVDDEGFLVAAGEFSDGIGPSWWDVAKE